MPIAKMRASNCPTKTTPTDQKLAKPIPLKDPFAEVKSPSLTRAISQTHTRLPARPSPVRRIGNIAGIAAELLNLNSGQAQILKATAIDFTASKHRSVVGGTVEIRTENLEAASKLLPMLGFYKVNDGYTLTNPRFQKAVTLGDGMTTQAKAEIVETPLGTTIAVTIDRNWKLI
jgi:hypothetical protein